MLKQSDIHPTIPATDLARAHAWYADKLGLDPDQEFPGALYYRVGESSAFLLYSAPVSGTSEHQVAAWVVKDLESEVGRLRGRGVVFEEYDTPGLRTEGGRVEPSSHRQVTVVPEVTRSALGSNASPLVSMTV